MNQLTLYLFIGYPGAGKTSIAKVIAEHTNAFHIWADVERHKLFKQPTHSQQESEILYQKLNNATEYLLAHRRSVIFDTTFNHKFDRDKLRAIAKKYHAKVVLIWVTTPLNIARQRAVNSPTKRNNYDYYMSLGQFSQLASKLEPPTEDEPYVAIDGTNLNEQAILKQLGIKPQK